MSEKTIHLYLFPKRNLANSRDIGVGKTQIYDAEYCLPTIKTKLLHPTKIMSSFTPKS